MTDQGLEQKVRATERFIHAIDMLVQHKLVKSLRALAPEIGLHPSAITAMKSGSGRYVGVENIILLCDKYPVSQDYILKGQGAALMDEASPQAQMPEITPSLISQLYEACDQLEGETAGQVKALIGHLIDENIRQKDKIIELMNDLMQLQVILRSK